MRRTAKSLPFIFILGTLLACSSFTKLLHRSGTEFTVRISTEASDKDAIVEKAVRSLESKLSAIRLDGVVNRVNDAPDLIKVRIFGEPLHGDIRKTLFTAYQLEMRPVAGVQYSYQTEDEARAKAKVDQEVLPDKANRSGDRPAFYIVEKGSVINGDDIRTAKASEDVGATSNYRIFFTLKPESVEKFRLWTRSHIGSYLAIVLNKEVQTAPVIKGEMTDQGVIEGHFTREEAESIALDLNSGYLPATMTVTDEAQFGG